MTYAPTRFALLPALALLGLSIGTLLDPGLVLPWAMAAAMFLLALFLDGWLLPSGRDFKLTRSLPAEVGVGIDFKMTLTLTNLGRSRVKVRLLDILPRAMVGPRAPLRFEIQSHEQAEATLEFSLDDRGEYKLDQATLVVAGPLRLLRRVLRLSAPAALAGVPGIELLQSNRLILKALQDADAGVSQSRGVGRGGEFESLAPYVPGDPPHQVDWKAFARTGQLAVRRFVPERRRTVMLACDAGRLMGGRVGGRRKVDLALASLCRLAAAALHRGDLVGLIIFDGAVRALVPPRAGPGQLPTIIRASLGVKAAHTETAFTPAFVAMNHAMSRRALVVLATDFDNEAQGWELNRNLAAIRRRHVAIVCAMRDPVFNETIKAPVSDLPGAYRQLASLTLLEERTEILNRIHKSGVHTIDAEPDELSGPLLNLYGRIVASSQL